MRHDWPRLTSWTSSPIFASSGVWLARNDDRGVVLLSAVESVGELVIQPDAIDFSSWLIQLRRPGATAVERNIGAPVVGLDHDLAVFRIDPDVVIVAMRSAKDRKRLAAVGGFKESFRARVNHVGIRRVGAERDVIKWTLDHRRSDRGRLWI